MSDIWEPKGFMRVLRTPRALDLVRPAGVVSDVCVDVANQFDFIPDLLVTV